MLTKSLNWVKVLISTISLKLQCKFKILLNKIHSLKNKISMYLWYISNWLMLTKLLKSLKALISTI